MDIFSPTTFTWGELGLFKWGAFLIGIAAGAYWPGVFAPYVPALIIVGLILFIPPTLVWFKEH